MSHAPNHPGEACFPDHFVEFAGVTALATITGERDGKSLAALRLQKCRGFDQHAMAFALAQARGHQHDLLVRRHAPRVAQPPHPRRIDRPRREAPEIDAAIDDGNAFACLRISLGYVLGGEGRIGDDDIAAGHHRIVIELDRRAPGIDAVKGRDQRHAGAPRRGERHPGRRARAGVNEIDTLGPDEMRESRHIGGHGERVLGRGGEADRDPALRLQFADQPAAFGSDKGAGARAR